MKKISIAYNPYFVQTEIKVNGETPEPGTRFVQVTKGTRLLNWVTPFMNELFRTYREKDISFEFSGTQQDAEDFYAAIKSFNAESECDFQLDEIHTAELGSKPMESLQKLYDDGKEGPFAELFNSDKMKAAFARATAPEFEVNVIATFSSGKSTLLNALLGKNFMPSKQEACTATIASIEDCDDQPVFTAVRYGKDGRLLTQKPELATRKLLTVWNDDENTSRIEIKGDIPTVDETKESKYVFIDTPGPNNSRNIEHRKTTFEAIKSKPLSMIIYMLDGEHLGSTDDDNLLTEVANTMADGGRQAQDRFIFVLNKLDEYDPDEDSIESAIDHARQYLQKHGIENPLLIPISALLAKLLRIKQYSPRDLSATAELQLKGLMDKFAICPDLNLYEHCKGSINQTVIQRIESRLKQAKSDEERALIYSGVPVLEELLQDFLYRHAVPAKIKDAVDSFDRVLRDYEKTLNLKGILEQSDKEIQQAAEAIRKFSASKDSLEKTEKFKREIRSIVFDLSTGTKKKLNDLAADEEDILRDLKHRLDRGNVDSINEAQQLCAKAENMCKDFEIDVHLTLQKAFKTECLVQLDQLREKYQEYITKIQNTAFPGNDKVRDLELSVLDMPNSGDQINSNRDYKIVVVGQKRVWWKLWLGKVDITEKRPFVDFTPIYEEFLFAIRDFAARNIRNFKKQANIDLEASKDRLIAVMDAKQEEIHQQEEAIAKAGNDQTEKEKQKLETQVKIDWFQNFHAKLQKILAI